MERLPLKISSDHVPLFIFLLLALTDSSTVATSSEKSEAFPSLFAPPGNVREVKVVTQNETSITLMWNKVNNISTYILRNENNGKEENINISSSGASITRVVSSLSAGTKYNFTLFTVFEGVNSTGYTFDAVTAPLMVTLVNVTERSASRITLEWNVAVDKNWTYSLGINGENVQFHPNRSSDVVSYSLLSVHPGTKYPFSLTTVFFGISSRVYEDFTVTAIDCTSVNWYVTNSSIQGMVEGLFTNATASDTSQSHVSHGGSNVSFTGLYPGETYVVSLGYETQSRYFPQCSLELTIIPPDLTAYCEYAGAGYSVFIAWNKPAGVWTEVEVNVTGKSHQVKGQQHIIISGFQPARTYEISLASLSRSQSSPPFVFSCSTDPRGVIAGSVCAVLIFAALVGLMIFILVKKPDFIRKKIRRTPASAKTYKGVSAAKFPDHFYQLSRNNNRGFRKEHESLINVGTWQSWKEALRPDNKAKNRFVNVLPYDWCRVKLTTSSLSGTSDYINASYMPGYNDSREYIATQGPLASTINDFWRMIWEQRVKCIVMVTNCGKGDKCEQYWPENSEPCLYGALSVTMSSEQQEPNWTLRKFRVKQNNTSEECIVNHFHFTAWPRSGVPQGTHELIQFRGLVRQHVQREGAGAPTVVHCSGGVGRTGTMIALDVLLQQLENGIEVDIHGFVHKMRQSRQLMVQTESQYVFLHQCIMDCIQQIEETEEPIYENPESIYATAIELDTHA